MINHEEFNKHYQAITAVACILICLMLLAIGCVLSGCVTNSKAEKMFTAGYWTGYVDGFGDNELNIKRQDFEYQYNKDNSDL